MRSQEPGEGLVEVMATTTLGGPHALPVAQQQWAVRSQRLRGEAVQME